jgi:hypothetical protein
MPDRPIAVSPARGAAHPRKADKRAGRRFRRSR